MTWLVTGGAGFIGSHLIEALLRSGETVVGLDNFATGSERNLDEVRVAVGAGCWSRFRLLREDIRDVAACVRACAGVQVVLHQAALGSVPGSLADPLACHATNVTGFANLLLAARDAGVRRFVYASSSAVYGDDGRLPKVESQLGSPLSPYAATKWMNEVYAGVFARCYQLATVGLRYFNVYGPRQDAGGAYAAVIPAWIAALVREEPVYINGDGGTSRDFCYVADVVRANLAAATTTNSAALNQVYNVAGGCRTTLDELFSRLREKLAPGRPRLARLAPIFRPPRAGDVLHSQADINKARQLLGFEPAFGLERGLDAALGWYLARLV